ncbi:MAG: hypothetical protein OXI33_13535 [Chloroflexota bacterium]|nr:hypothetical protein [Chloroflexota bacterium]
MAGVRLMRGRHDPQPTMRASVGHRVLYCERFGGKYRYNGPSGCTVKLIATKHGCPA